MAADDRRPGGRGARARRGRRGREGVLRATDGRPPAWPRSSWATTRPAPSTSAASRRPPARSGSPASTIACRRHADEEVAELIERLNADDEVSGILVQLPVPGHLDGVRLTGLIDPAKDVDGLTPVSAGLLALGPGLRPCTPAGVMELLDHAAPSWRAPRRSSSAARTSSASRWPSCCSRANATVTTCHSRTRDLAAVCRRADVLVVAVGRAGLVAATG